MCSGAVHVGLVYLLEAGLGLCCRCVGMWLLNCMGIDEVQVEL